MSGVIIAPTGSEAWLRLLDQIITEGEPVTARGHETLELRNRLTVTEQSRFANVLSTQRRPSARIAATEATHLVSGLSSLEQLDLASGGAFSQFADGGRLRGAYGPRLRDQLDEVAYLIGSDPGTRQAAASIWNGNDGGTSDVPCTMSLQFAARGGMLHLTVFMRSSDAWLGIPYDWESFSVLHRTMAAAVGMPAGEYAHFAGSVHLYRKDLEKVKAVLDAGLVSPERGPIQSFEPVDGVKVSPGAIINPGPMAQQQWYDRQRAAKAVVLRLPGWEANGGTAALVPELAGSTMWSWCRECGYVTDGSCKECRP